MKPTKTIRVVARSVEYLDHYITVPADLDPEAVLEHYREHGAWGEFVPFDIEWSWCYAETVDEPFRKPQDLVEFFEGVEV